MNAEELVISLRKLVTSYGLGNVQSALTLIGSIERVYKTVQTRDGVVEVSYTAYEAIRNAIEEASINGQHDKIQAIKAARRVIPDLSLPAGKDLVEALFF